MNSSTDFRKLLPRYLVGELSPEQTAEIDEKYLFDDFFADALEEARLDLLDSLAAGELSANERSRVERALAQIPQYEGALRVARALRAKQEESRPAHRQVRRTYWIWATAAVVLCVATLVIFVKRQTSVTSPQMPQTSGTIPAPSTVSPTQQDGAQELAFVVLLSPEVSRGTDAHSSFAIPGNVRFVEFQIVLSATKEKTRYEVSVSSETRKEPLIVSDLEPKSLGSQRYLEFRALAGSLPPGKYSVFVSAETKGRPLQARYDLSLTQTPRRPLP